jgi:hypothetical protein
MVTIGGGVGSRPPQGLWATDPQQKQVELSDPRSGSWAPGLGQQLPRAYHSTAVLLPDGRVVSAGDEFNGGGTAEIYSPPYLFRGPRPIITSAPASMRWAGTSYARTPSSSDVVAAALVAPAATTHANDMSQRYVPLTLINRGGGLLELKAPANGRVAPPGYYMLFLLSSRGVPSVAKFVRVGP